MANRIVGNVIIVDSAMGNSPVLSSSAQLHKFKLGSVAFWSSDTTGSLVLSGTNTSNTYLRLGNSVNSPNTTGIVLDGVTLHNLKVPVLTAGTAWIYIV